MKQAMSPLTPPDCDLRDFAFMPLEVARLRRSKQWLFARRRPELGFYALNLWMASWHEVPAASLEDDDAVLADAALCSPARWAKIRAEVMRGWILCADGRLYHPVVAEKANEAWLRKRQQRDRTAAARRARAINHAISVTESVTGSDSMSESASKRERHGQGDGEGRAGPPAQDDAKAYAFEGKTIRLSAVDYERWRTAYPNLDLRAELQGLDDYYSATRVRDWFARCSAALAKRHRESAAARKVEAASHGAGPTDAELAARGQKRVTGRLAALAAAEKGWNTLRPPAEMIVAADWQPRGKAGALPAGEGDGKAEPASHPSIRA